MDVEKTIQFILDTQAKHEVTIQQILEAQAKHETAIQQWDERFLKFQQETGQRFATLVDVCMSLAHHGEETDRLIRELRDAQASTDYKLNALIDAVDKLVKRNGSRQ